MPWFCMGVVIALFRANHGTAKKANENNENQGNYMTEGMCIGMCVGTALGGNGQIYGMLVGLAIGMMIKKNQ